jgi:hypothetical protein
MQLSSGGGVEFAATDGTNCFQLSKTALTAINGAVFTGSGAGLTSLNGTNISSGTVADARIAATIARVAMGSQNLTFTSGFGIANGGTSFAVASNAEIYQSSTLVASIGTTGTRINIGGTFYTLSVVAGVVNAA